MHSAETESARSLRVLVVENHEDTLICIRRHLESCGHVVDVARNAGEASGELRKILPDVLLCDIGLPDRNGWEILSDLDSGRPKICIAMSGYGQTADLERSREAGFDHHLIKPFLPRQLDELLARN